MQIASRHGKRLSSFLIGAVLASATLGLPRAAAGRVAGGAGARADCYSEFDGITALPNSHPPRVDHADGRLGRGHPRVSPPPRKPAVWVHDDEHGAGHDDDHSSNDHHHGGNDDHVGSNHHHHGGNDDHDSAYDHHDGGDDDHHGSND